MVSERGAPPAVVMSLVEIIPRLLALVTQVVAPLEIWPIVNELPDGGAINVLPAPPVIVTCPVPRFRLDELMSRLVPARLAPLLTLSVVVPITRAVPVTLAPAPRVNEGPLPTVIALVEERLPLTSDVPENVRACGPTNAPALPLRTRPVAVDALTEAGRLSPLKPPAGRLRHGK